MVISIDHSSAEPLYLQLRAQVIEAIARGELQPGQALPSVRALAADLGINLHTVNKSCAMRATCSCAADPARASRIRAKLTGRMRRRQRSRAWRMTCSAWRWRTGPGAVRAERSWNARQPRRPGPMTCWTGQRRRTGRSRRRRGRGRLRRKRLSVALFPLRRDGAHGCNAVPRTGLRLLDRAVLRAGDALGVHAAPCAQTGMLRGHRAGLRWHRPMPSSLETPLHGFAVRAHDRARRRRVRALRAGNPG